MGFFDLFRGQKSEDANKRYRQGGYGATELFLKAYNGDADGVTRLLAQGADPNERSFANFPDSEIIASARKGRELAARGYASDQVSEQIWGKDAPVHALTLMMQAFRERQNNPNAYYHTELGYSALIFPVLHGDTRVVKLLVDAGASPNAPQLDGTFPLYAAAVMGNLAIVKVLLSSGAEIDRKTPYGVTALRAAIDAEHFDVAVHLIVRGANLNAWADDGFSILGAAISKAEWSLAGMVFFHSSMSENEEEPLFSTNPEVDSYFWNNFTVPMSFVESDDLLMSLEDVEAGGLSKKLVAASATGEPKRSQPDHYMSSVNLELLAACSGSYGHEVEEMMHGVSAVHEASFSDEPFLLFFATRRVVHRGQGNSAIADFFHHLVRNYHLARAIDERDDQAFEVCLAGGADPNQACHYGRTRLPPIVLASVLRRKRMCERLIEAGADINRRTIELCVEAAGSGGEDSPSLFLAQVMEDVDPERSKEVYQACVDSGDLYRAARNLAMLVEADEPDLAIGLYELSAAAGNALSARDLALLYRDSDPDRAKELFGKAIELGDEDVSSFQLALMVMDDEPEYAKKLLVRSFRAGNRTRAPYWLAALLEEDNPEEAASYYRIAADAGDPYACERLAWLVYQDDRDSAVELCETAIESGESTGAEYLLASMLSDEEPERSAKLYERCLNEGSFTSLASFRLASLIEHKDPARAAELYELSISEGFLPAYAKLARLVSKDDGNRAIELCERAVELGDTCDAPFYLAWLIEGDDPERAKLLYQICIDNGYSDGAANNLANLIKSTEPDKAKSLFEQSIEAGNLYYAAANLADMIAESNPRRAEELYQASIDAGNLLQCAKLARMLLDSDKERARGLCEKAVDAGDRGDAAFVLAWLLEGSDLQRAKELYQECVDTGFCWGPARNLANLVKDEDPLRATELYEMALQAGDGEVRVPLAKLLVDSDRQRAAQLCEEAIADGDVDEGLHWLAWTLEGTNKPRAIELYQRRIDAGNFLGSAFNLARLIEREEPERALELYKMELESANRGIAAESIANMLAYTLRRPDQAITYYEMAMDSGRETDANCLNSYGVLLMTRDRDKAMRVFRQAIEAGNLSYATCNLGHMLFFENPDEAKSLYKKSMEHEAQNESTEAYIGLSLLLENSDPEQSSALLETAMSRANFNDSIEFMVDCFQSVNPVHSEKLRAMTTEG